MDELKIFTRREAVVSFAWSSNIVSFFSGATQTNRKRIKAKKKYKLTVSGLRKDMEYLVNFYNSHHGCKDEFVFTYNGVKETCVFCDKLNISQKLENQKVVGYECEINLEVTYQSQSYSSPSASDLFNLIPVDGIKVEYDWATNFLDMLANGRQQTYTSPDMNFTMTVRGLKKDRERLINLYNSHGPYTPLLFTNGGVSYQVTFPDSLEVKDKLENQKVVAFECELTLKAIKLPDDGTFYEDAPIYPGAVVKELDLKDFTSNGYVANGINFSSNIGALSSYRITDCSWAFKESKLDSIPYLYTAGCKRFDGMFMKSSISNFVEMDLSSAYSVYRMFAWSSIERISSIDFSSVEVIDGTQRGDSIFFCSKIKSIGRLVSPKGVCGDMFYGTSQLESISELDIRQATSCSRMFHGSSVSSLPVIDLLNCTDASGMFQYCDSLESIRLVNTGKLEKVTNMFQGCSRLKSIEGLDLTNAQVIDIDPVIGNINGTFQSCPELKSITIIDRKVDLEGARKKYVALMKNRDMLNVNSGNFLQMVTIIGKDGTYILRRTEEIV